MQQLINLLFSIRLKPVTRAMTKYPNQVNPFFHLRPRAVSRVREALGYNSDNGITLSGPAGEKFL